MEFFISRNTILTLCLLAWVPLAHALEQRDTRVYGSNGLYFTSGLEYESGDYGTGSTTDLWRVPLEFDYQRDRLSAGIGTELLSARSDGTIITSSMTRMTSVTRSTSGKKSVTGIGDINMYASYRLPGAKDSDVSYHVTGRIKLGTADSDKGLGTGENDYALEGGARTLFESVILFGNLGYQISGDSATINYRNVWYANGGGIYPLDAKRNVGVMLELSQAATPGFDDPAQLTLFYNQDLANQRHLYFYVLLGLTNGSPDSGVGANLTFKL